MPPTLPKQYRILTGPYRLAISAMLARFKGQLTYSAHENFLRLSPNTQMRVTSDIAASLANVRDRFAENRPIYERFLSECIGRLEELSDTNKSPASDLDNVANLRCEQILGYLDRNILRWRLQPTPTTKDFCELISDSYWPYYCLVYPESGIELKNWRFASWVANSNLSQRSAKTMLYPSIEDCLNNAKLRSILDLASDAPLDFDNVEHNVGYVQILHRPSETAILDTSVLDSLLGAERRLSYIDQSYIDRHLKEANSSFTDLFYFNNQALRLVLTIGNRDHSPSDEPTGVIFLAAADLNALARIMDPEGDQPQEALKRIAEEAWSDVGGSDFSRTSYFDFRGTRELFSELQRNTRLKARNDEGIDIAHSAKNILNNASGSLRLAVLEKSGSLERRGHLATAQQLVSFVGQDFGFHKKLLHMQSSPDGTSFLSELDDRELFDLVVLFTQWLLTIRQMIDISFKRKYKLQGKPIVFSKLPPPKILNSLKARVAEVYRRLDRNDEARQLETSIAVGLDRDPLCCALFFACREWVDNVRPRQRDDKIRVLNVVLEPPSRFDVGWREIRVTQIVSGAESDKPFVGADEASSIARFNSRFGPDDGGVGLARIIADRAGFDVSLGQHRFIQHVLFPMAIQGR